MSDDSGNARPVTAAAALVEYVADLVANRYTAAEVRKALQKLFPDTEVSSALVAVAIKKANKLLIARLRRSPDAHRAKALGFYESVVSNPRAKISERLAAQQAIVNMLGLMIEGQKGETAEDSARAAREFLQMSLERTDAPTVEEVEDT